ncbi:MAG TPA: energy transducer TonB, partial [bacterium]|nr:energy transducer TonB [bacterium]
ETTQTPAAVTEQPASTTTQPAETPADTPAETPEETPEETTVTQPEPTPRQPEPQKTAPADAAATVAELTQPVRPVVKEGDLVPLVEGEVTFPVVTKQVQPRVTPMARRLNVHGTIVAQALIDENGGVIETRIIRNIPGRHGLDTSVQSALKEWKFTPAVKQGVRVKVYFTQAFSF